MNQTPDLSTLAAFDDDAVAEAVVSARREPALAAVDRALDVASAALRELVVATLDAEVEERRRHSLADCRPRWCLGDSSLDETGAEYREQVGVAFDCPEGHDGCSHVVFFTGPAATHARAAGHAFEALTLAPAFESSCGCRVALVRGQFHFLEGSR